MRKQERRREARVSPGGVRARVRPGHSLVLLDVTAGGALVEARCQLRPGSRVDVHLESDDRRQMVGAHVTRCTVATIDRDAGITYRAALSFTEPCEWVREATTRHGLLMPGEPPGTSAVASALGDSLPALDEIQIRIRGRGWK
jgi:hypothetical protein